MRDQLLDSMELERERGITIKAQAVRVLFRAADERAYELNLIDTPGHVDFSYEVSRSLAACEGAILVVDAAQGIEAQTLANAYLAIENELEIVPVVNKIDLPSADADGVAAQVADLVGGSADDVIRISAKTGLGVEAVLQAVVDRVPPPRGEPDAPARALIFDSSYDQYRGVVAFVRVVDGSFHPREKVKAMAQGTVFDVEELGFFSPAMRAGQAPLGRRGGVRDHGAQGRVAAAGGGHAHAGPARRRRAAARVPRGEADGVRRALPDRLRPVPGAARRAREAEAERRRALVRARDLARARVRVPVRLPRPPAHGHRARAPGARARPRPPGHRPQRRLPRAGGERRVGRGAQPRADARPRHPRDRGAVRAGVDHLPVGSRRRGHGAEPGAPRRLRAHGLPEPRAGAADLRDPAGRDRARLLRPAQVAHPRVCVVRLRPDRVPARRRS